MDPSPVRLLRAGGEYFIFVFAIAFAMGILRTLVITPAIGANAAVSIEVPIILVVSWLAARRTVARYAIERSMDRAMAGLSAFSLLMVTELALARVLADQTPAEWLASLFALPGIIGLAGQIVFALMPLLVGANRMR